jgi:hypothetical protein
LKKAHKQRVRPTSKPANKLLTRKEYAAHRGITRQRIDRLISQGRIPLTEDGLIDAIVADAQLEATVPEAAKAGNGKASPALEKLRLVQAARAESAKRILDLEYRRRSGALIDREKADGRLEKVVEVILRRLRQIPSSLAGVMVACTSPWEANRLLDQAIEQSVADALGYEYHPRPYVPYPPMVGSPCCRVFNAEGRVVLIHWQERDGWLISIKAGWHVATEFFDRDGNAIDPPQVVDGKVIGAPDVVGGEFEGVLGERCRYAAGVGKWADAAHPEVHPHPVEVFSDGAWIPAGEWHERRKHHDKENGKAASN